jgi:hypothetical protein
MMFFAGHYLEYSGHKLHAFKLHSTRDMNIVTKSCEKIVFSKNGNTDKTMWIIFKFYNYSVWNVSPEYFLLFGSLSNRLKSKLRNSFFMRYWPIFMDILTNIVLSRASCNVLPQFFVQTSLDGYSIKSPNFWLIHSVLPEIYRAQIGSKLLDIPS